MIIGPLGCSKLTSRVCATDFDSYWTMRTAYKYNFLSQTSVFYIICFWKWFDADILGWHFRCSSPLQIILECWCWQFFITLSHDQVWCSFTGRNLGLDTIDKFLFFFLYCQLKEHDVRPCLVAHVWLAIHNFSSLLFFFCWSGWASRWQLHSFL